MRGRADAAGGRPGEGVRLRLVPREHGAAFMSIHSLLLGLLAAVVANGHDFAGAVVAVGFGALFLPFTAAVSHLTSRSLAARARRRTVQVGSALAALGLVALLIGPVRDLLLVGALASVVALAFLVARRRSGPRGTATQLAAIAGISILASLTWLLVAGPTPRWQLAAVAAFLAFGGTVPYVRERVRRRPVRNLTMATRARRGALALGWQLAVAAMASVAVGAGLVHPLTGAAFLPGAAKTAVGILSVESAPPIRRIGYLETVVSTVFAVLAGVGLGLEPLA